MEILSRVQIRNKQRRYRIDRTSAADFCYKALCAINKREFGLSVAFVGKREMRNINSRYRHVDYPTDVLSFNYLESFQEDGAPLLGEILVSPAVARENAQSYGADTDKEIKKLLVHGILHLAGFDHDTDSGEMRHRQATLMRRSFVRKASVIILADDSKARS